MKHIAQLQTEFVKMARHWNDLTLKEQREYLKKHRKSKRKLTAKPEKTHKEIKSLDDSVQTRVLNDMANRALDTGNADLFNKVTKLNKSLKRRLTSSMYNYGTSSKDFIEKTFPQLRETLDIFSDDNDYNDAQIMIDALRKNKDIAKDYKEDLEKLYFALKDTGLGDDVKNILRYTGYKFPPKIKISALADEFQTILKKYDENANVVKVEPRIGPFGHGPELVWTPSIIADADVSDPDRPRPSRKAIKRAKKLVTRAFDAVDELSKKYDNVSASYTTRMFREYEGPFFTDIPKIVLSVGGD